VLLTTPYVIIEWKKNQILIAHQKERVDLDKKGQLGTRGFCPYFCAVNHPLCDIWMEKAQIIIAHQKEGVDLDKKSTARD